MNSEPSESWNPLVVDISSDEEADRFESDSSFDSVYRWLNDIALDSNNIIVDLENNVSSVGDYSSLRPKTREENDNSRAENEKCMTENVKSNAENDKIKAENDESDDDCMILDGDPDKVPEICDDSKKNEGDESDDLQITGEKGQIACRDFPHSRHLCANFPFKTTPHEQHCKLCHCFVCDSPAPCTYWHSSDQSSGHCHATDKDEMWKNHRKTFKTVKNLQSPSLKPLFELQNLDMITNRTRAPVRPCSNAIAPLPINKHRINHPRLIKSTTMPRSKTFGVSRTASQSQHKRVGSVGSGFASSTMNQSQQKNYVSNQMHIHARKVSFRIQPPPVSLPRTQSMPMTSQRSSRTPRTTETDERTLKWKDVLADMAAELGVSDAINGSSMMPSQTSKSTPAQSVSHSNQLRSDVQSTAQVTSSTSQNITGNSNFDSYLSPEDINFLPDLSGVDPTPFPYDFDVNWM